MKVNKLPNGIRVTQYEVLCNVCRAEFRVVVLRTKKRLKFCPFCGNRFKWYIPEKRRES